MEQAWENLKNKFTGIKVYGNYEPSNCRWATYKEQANNKRDFI